MFWMQRWKFWRYKAYECPDCGWQGMCEPAKTDCPDCGESTIPRSWWDTWGVTLLILAVVVATVLFVGYFGQGN